MVHLSRHVAIKFYLTCIDWWSSNCVSVDSRIDGLALASQSRLLYYTDADRRQVGVMTLNGKFKKILIRQNLSSPRAIVLDEVQGLVTSTQSTGYSPR